MPPATPPPELVGRLSNGPLHHHSVDHLVHRRHLGGRESRRFHGDGKMDIVGRALSSAVVGRSIHRLVLRQ